MTVENRPKKINSAGQKELDKCEKQFEKFDENVKQLTLDNMNKAPILETEPQTKIAQKDLAKMNAIYLKPFKTHGSREKFNDRFRDEWNFAKEMVQFQAENKEVFGETIELWTKPFPGCNAEFWIIPCGKPVWGPRHLAERIAGCRHHTLVMESNKRNGSDDFGNEYYGSMAVSKTVQRLDAAPVSTHKSIFMGAINF